LKYEKRRFAAAKNGWSWKVRITDGKRRWFVLPSDGKELATGTSPTPRYWTAHTPEKAAI